MGMGARYVPQTTHTMADKVNTVMNNEHSVSPVV